MEITDQELLRRFRHDHCETSFRQIVDRHLKMVYSVAYRVTGERGLAEEVTQSTFTKLTETDPAPEVIAGWLYHTARNLALTAVRSETRRKQREQLAVTMNFNEPEPDQLTEHLEPALEQLGSEDRDILVLRFFEERNLRDVGAELGLSEDAARMRVNRALEKLKGIFGKLGITGTTTWLATALPSSASAAIPSGLGGTITTTILSGGTVAAAATTIATETASNTMNAFLNLKTAVAVVAAATIAGTSTYVAKDKQVDTLQAEYQTLNQAHAMLAEQQSNALETIRFRDRRIENLAKDVGDLPRLRGELDRLNREILGLNALKVENERLEAMLIEMNPNGRSNYEETMRLANALWENRETMATAAYMGLLTEALATAADQNGGEFPQSIEAAKEAMGDKFYGGVRILGLLLRADDFEVVYRGNLYDITDPENTILLREIKSRRVGPATPEGDKERWRICYFANRSMDAVAETVNASGETRIERVSDHWNQFE